MSCAFTENTRFSSLIQRLDLARMTLRETSRPSESLNSEITFGFNLSPH